MQKLDIKYFSDKLLIFLEWVNMSSTGVSTFGYGSSYCSLSPKQNFVCKNNVQGDEKLFLGAP